MPLIAILGTDCEVLSVIRSLVEDGMTSILVTHEMRFAEEISDKVLFTENGRIAEEGSPADIFHRSQNPRLRQFVRGLGGGRDDLDHGGGI